jgi:transcriptional regulator with XRE-family HTH domain
MESDPYSSPLAYFGTKLKRLRERTGMTQGDVAKETNYALSTISAYERGTLIPPSDFAKRADKLFGTGGHGEDDEGDLEGLQKLVETVSVRPWFRDRVEVERKAREIREYDAYQVCYSKHLTEAHLERGVASQGISRHAACGNLKATALLGKFESSYQRILKPGRTVALQSYHRPDDHADAGTSPPRE